MSTPTITSPAPLSVDNPVNIPDAPPTATPPRFPNLRRKTLIWALRLLLVGSVVVLWEVGAKQGWINPFYFSQPSAIFDALVEYVGSGAVWPNLVATLQATALGFIVGTAVGLPLGLLLGRYELLNGVLSPILAGLNAVPRVALAPLFVLWFGIGMSSKVVLAASLVFFIVMASAEAGVRATEPELLRMSRSLGAKEHQIFRTVVLPASVPSIFAGLRLGLTYSLLGVVFGEMVSAEKGLGQQVSLFGGTYQAANLFTVLILLGALGLLLNSLAMSLERFLLRWQR